MDDGFGPKPRGRPNPEKLKQQQKLQHGTYAQCINVARQQVINEKLQVRHYRNFGGDMDRKWQNSK